MSATLEGGWYSRSDKAFGVRFLRAAYEKVKANPGSAGVDGVTVMRFERDLEEELSRLSRASMDGSYRPRAVKQVCRPESRTESYSPWSRSS